MASAPNYLKVVRDQYENYPYPPRNPEDEKFSFLYYNPDALDTINYYHYSGKRDFTKGFRILVAGGGTGDVSIMFAEQFKGRDVEIIQLDISKASADVAKARAKVRGLDNITWLHGSLLDAPKLFKEKFDFIDCSGVLHHLESPEAGLAALAAVLKDGGVMSLMLYATYGRAEIYKMQDLMKMINRNEPDQQTKVENCKAILNSLPATHPLILEKNNIDIRMGDVGIYDLFLHSHDVAYTVPDVYRFLKTAGLIPTHFFPDSNEAGGNDLYRMESYVTDPGLTAIIRNLSEEENRAGAELIHGKIIKHGFYAAKKKSPLPSLDDLENVPFLAGNINDASYQAIRDLFNAAPMGGDITLELFGKKTVITKRPYTAILLQYLDGKTTLAEIFKKARETHEDNPSIEALKKEFSNIFSAFIRQDWMFLKHKSVPKNRTMEDVLQGRPA